MDVPLGEIPVKAKKISLSLKGGEVLALIGELGSGKTTFTKALAKNLGIKKRITSPTFTLMHSYPVVLKMGDTKRTLTLHHLDLYRTESYAEVAQIGLPEFWGKRDHIVIIEWADKIRKHLPKKTKFIYFHHEQES
jgi:tRNA threonylcarbamoyladenosine biosynthesis protein TsaE